jgi:hypothetical protein
MRRGFALEYATLGWNVIGIVVLAVTAITARSVALAGFGLDSMIEIGASIVVIWELSGTDEHRQQRALRLIGVAFALLAVNLAVQSTLVLVTGFHPGHSPAGHRVDRDHCRGHVRTGRRQGPHRQSAGQSGAAHRGSGHPRRWHPGDRCTGQSGAQHHARVVVADPVAGYVLVFYATREVRTILTDQHTGQQ